VADTRGAVTGLAVDRPYRAASLLKAMVLVAYLDRLDGERREPSPAQRERLEAMIRVSDNEAATDLHRELGPEAMRALARRAGMRSFADSGSWSESRITAADQARFFAALDRLLPDRFREYARGLLQSVDELQSWGVPRAARPRWRVLFKGGWRPAGDGSLVHQAARLERGPRTLALAVLSDGNPDQPYGEETIRQVATRLLTPGGLPVTPNPPAVPAQLTSLRALDGRRPPSPPPLQPISVEGAYRK
jgi:beta-lactamase class A